MAKPGKTNFFWPSYTDLMTSLFFIMLVLYVLSYAALRAQQRATEEQLRKITEIQKAVENLPQAYFVHQPQYKRFVLNKQIQFDLGESEIKPQYHDYLRKVGTAVNDTINALKTRFQNDSIKYLLVIEGMASKVTFARNYELSYERALALYRFWEKEGIVFDPNVCEVQIAGSGTGGIGRASPDYLNQRFLIQIVPKIGVIKK